MQPGTLEPIGAVSGFPPQIRYHVAFSPTQSTRSHLYLPGRLTQQHTQQPAPGASYVATQLRRARAHIVGEPSISVSYYALFRDGCLSHPPIKSLRPLFPFTHA